MCAPDSAIPGGQDRRRRRRLGALTLTQDESVPRPAIKDAHAPGVIPSPKGRERLAKLRRPVDGSSDMSKIGTCTYPEALDPLDLSSEFLNALRRHLERRCDVVGVRVKQHNTQASKFQERNGL